MLTSGPLVRHRGPSAGPGAVPVSYTHLLDVDRVHVMVRGRIVAEGDASLIDRIDEEGFEQFEQIER